MMPKKHSTKDYITISLYYLMSKFDYESISVTDICAKARVSRMSFYRYFLLAPRNVLLARFSPQRGALHGSPVDSPGRGPP